MSYSDTQKLLPAPAPQFIVSGDDVYQRVEAGEFNSYLKVAATKVTGKPIHRRSGLRIPVALMDQIKAFFEHTYADYHGESEVQLLYNNEYGWSACPLPQEKKAGMSVTPIDDIDKLRRVLQRAKDEANGVVFDRFGTGHHHCSASAFASGTDQHDEKEKEGIHFTIGNIGSREYSIHTRVSLHGQVTDCVLSDWFESRHQDIAPAALEAQLTWELKQPAPAGTEFPAWWLESLEPPTSRITQGNFSGDWQNSGEWERGNDGVWRPGKKKRRGKRNAGGVINTYLMDLNGLIMEYGCVTELLCTVHYHNLLVEFAKDHDRDSDDIMMSVTTLYRSELAREGWTESDILDVRTGVKDAIEIAKRIDATEESNAAADAEAEGMKLLPAQGTTSD